MTRSRSTSISTALWRGLRKRCPHCGHGPLFSGWTQRERCSHCGLVFEANPGDTWAYNMITGRLPVGVMILLIYFRVGSSPGLGLTILGLLLALVIWTTPNRWGAGIALHYLVRLHWPDPADQIPPPHVTGPADKPGARAEEPDA